MLTQLLASPKGKQTQLYKYLPVSTSYQDELKKTAQQLLQDKKQYSIQKNKWGQFIPNQNPANIQNQLILLKLKGYIDQKDITAKSTQIKKLPTKVQVGTMIQGDPFQAIKIKNQKKQPSIVDYYLKKDKQVNFSQRKFAQIQKVKHRHKKITKKNLKSKNKN